MTEIILVYDNPEDRKTLEDFESDKGIYLTFMDYGSKLQKKKSWELMEEWGARKLPFAMTKDGDSVMQCFYTEDGNHVINDLIKLL